MAFVRADDGVRISYEVRGKGPLTLLFMHGWAGAVLEAFIAGLG